jgi:hypothetical protein
MNMKRVLICLASLMLLGPAHAEVPKLFLQKTFTSATLAEAVNRYVAIGEAASIKELQQLAAQEDASQDAFSGKGFSVSERIGWVCRILYEPRGNSPLRAPRFGVLPLPEKTMPLEKWPLYPLALSGSTYFVLKQGYVPDGTPETVTHYLAYCKKNGVFRINPIAVPTKESAAQDAAALRQSLAWQAIQWQDHDGFSFPMGEQLTWSFLQNQAKKIADEPVAAQNSKTDSAAVSLR